MAGALDNPPPLPTTHGRVGGGRAPHLPTLTPSQPALHAAAHVAGQVGRLHLRSAMQFASHRASRELHVASVLGVTFLRVTAQSPGDAKADGGRWGFARGPKPAVDGYHHPPSVTNLKVAGGAKPFTFPASVLTPPGWVCGHPFPP